MLHSKTIAKEDHFRLMTKIPSKPLIVHSELPIKVNRECLPSTLLPFADFFKGFEKVEAVRSVFGDKTRAVLENLKISFIPLKFAYMGVSDEDGTLSVGTHHLKHSNVRTLYLDVIHELFHVKQWQEDREYFEKEHHRFLGDWSLYYSSPIEVPAYKHTVREAERIGMTRGEIVDYLKMGPTSASVFTTFLKEMELASGKSAHSVRLPIQINRKASISKFRFTDYFKGFDTVDAVKRVFGEKTSKVLGQLKVEFVQGSFVKIIPSDEDGCLVIGVPYLKSSNLTSIYLDVLLSLNIIKRASLGKRTPNKTQMSYLNSTVLFDSYKMMLEEARRLKVNDAKVMEHMSIPRFLMSSTDFEKFLGKLNLRARKVVERP